MNCQKKAMTMLAVVQNAVGGALCSVSRYLVGIGLFRLVGPTHIPVGVLCVNVLGSFLLGIFVTAVLMRDLDGWTPLVMIGFLGGFTTFSAFSFEAINLVQENEIGLAAIYVLLSVGGSLGGLVLGAALMRVFFQ